MIGPFSTLSFFSIWYWILAVLVWTLVGLRTLGVPHDMLLRAERLPQVADRVDGLAGIAAERLDGLVAAIGPAVAALAGFGLAMLAGLGFVWRHELALAAFALLLPLAVVGVGNVQLAVWVQRTGARGPELRRRLLRRRLWNQVIAALALVGIAVLAILHGPGRPLA
ncbi:MAG: hypothetical protein U1E34_08465 [Amaricoccus sp.]